MIYKFALTEPCPVEQITGKSNEVMIKTASGRVLIEPGSEKEKIVQAEIKKHPNALFFRAKAIKADEPNSNGDSFSKDQLLKAYKSFEGVPFFTNHENQDIEKAKGKIIFAEWDEKENSVYTIAFVDRDAYPHICRGIEQGYMTGVSMGASVEYSICNICENRAERTEDYCEHIRNRKSRKFTGKARNVRTGKIKEFKNEPVFEHNYGIKFIELSGVVDPACPSCHIEGIIPNESYLGKVANVENYLRMVKTAAIEKKASQAEIDQINQVLQTLENIAISLIQNRQQVEVEFASELVDVIATLQTWTDELIGAGYGNVESNVPGTYEGEEAPMESPEGEMQGGLETAPREDIQSTPATPASPVASEQAMGVGQTTGNPGQPLVNTPQMPITAPMRPNATSSHLIRRVADEVIDRFDLGNSVLQKVASLCEGINKTGDNSMRKRRTIASKEKQKEKTMKVLSSSWQEKQNFFEYIKEVPSMQVGDLRLAIKNRDDSFIIVAEDNGSNKMQIWTYEDLSDDEKKLIVESPRDAAHNFLDLFAKNTNQIREGVERMSKETKEAGANTVLATPEVITERQLADNASQSYHGRTGEEQQVITQKQLDSNIAYPRKGEKEVLTERQLNDADLKLNPRQDTQPEVITERQLQDSNGVSPRKGEDKHTITQDQLDREGYRTGTEPEVITEKQLGNVDAPWARQSSRNASMFKSAKEHMNAVVEAFAEVSLETGATPQELQEVARVSVASTQARVKLATALLEDSKTSEVLPFSKRVAYWNSKNVRVATASPAEVEQSLVSKLRAIASDVTINPDVLIDAVDVIGDGDGEQSISKKVDEKLAEASTEAETVNVKDELRQALVQAATEDEDETEDETEDEDENDDEDEKDEDEEIVESSKKERDKEREEILASLKSRKTVTASEEDVILNPDKLNGADIVIETDFEEVGTNRKASTFRKDIVKYAKTALATENMKLASITNVTIDGSTIQIAVQTDAGESSVEIPIGEEVAPVEEEVVPEGDLTGEGLEGGLGGEEVGFENINNMAYNKSKRMKRKAQSPMGGGMGGGAGAGVAPGSPEEALPGNAPGGDAALQALTTGDEDELLDDEIPTVGEKQAPWSICPECGSSDVDVIKEDDGGIVGNCNACGAEYEALVKKTVEFNIIKPTKSVGEEGEEVPEGPEGPEEVPALPVAAQTKLDKDSIVRIAANREANGDVCPSCGNKHCNVIASGNGSTECLCGKCGTGFEKNLLISSTNPSNGFLRVEWNVSPDNSCPECKKEARKFASKLKVSGMLKTASANSDSFPMANCIERIARTYGGNTVARFGPCKGKPMTDCVCKELQRLGFTKVRQLNKLAETLMQKDPMDECIEDQTNKGHSVVEANSICNCIKKKFASEDSDNIYVQAFGSEAKEGKIELTAYDLGTMNEMFLEEKQYLAKKAQEALESIDIGDDLEPLDSVDVEIDEIVEEEPEEVTVDSVTITGDNLEVVENIDNEEEEIAEEVEFENEETEGEDMETFDAEALAEALAMNSSRIRRSGAETNIKLAGKPKLIKTIEKDVEAGVPRSKATIRNEGSDNIDVPMATPRVPRSNATMGQEGADNINVPAGLPDVAVDSSYMGVEKEVQQGMPAINNEIKGTVIAEAEKNLKEAQRQLTLAKQMKEIDTVEKNVGVPRAKATLGHESAENIDVALGKPSVPRAKATMGNESADNIDVSATGPDVPIDSSYMGVEKEVQQGMPGINNEMLKQVQMKRDQQLERIANARKEEALRTTAWLAANGRIASDKATFDNVATALANFEVDKISTVAETMFPVIKTASKQQVVKTAGTGLPAIVIASQPQQEETFQNKLAGAFTIGSNLLNNKLVDDNER